MKNILSYDKFSMNEGIISTIKKYISKKQDLDDVVEGIFKRIKSHFYTSELVTDELKYDYDKKRGYNTSIAYKFNDTDLIKITKHSRAVYPRGFKLFINDDNITDLVSEYLVEDIYYFLIEKSQKMDLDLKKADQYNLKNRIKNRYGENGGSSARPLTNVCGYGYQPIDNLDTTKPPKGDDSEYHDHLGKPYIDPAPR